MPRNKRLKYEVITFHDNPVLVLHPQTQNQIQFGVEKAKIILASIPTITSFVNNYTSGEMLELYNYYFQNPRRFKQRVTEIFENQYEDIMLAKLKEDKFIV